VPLKQKGRWRSRLGLKGHIYYYDETPSKKRFQTLGPAVWSAIIAALSTILTAIFAFQNLNLTKANLNLTKASFMSLHRPKLEIRDVFVGLSPMFEKTIWEMAPIVVNSGESAAKNVTCEFTLITAALQTVEGTSSDPSVDPNYRANLLQWFPVNRDLVITPKKPAYILVRVTYTDSDSQVQPPITYCASTSDIYSPVVNLVPTKHVDCNELPISKLIKKDSD